MKLVKVPGIHIQWPWSQLILEKKKTIETRSYPISEKYLNKKLALIETPGPRGKKNGITRAMIIGIVTFDSSILYRSKKQWIADFPHHLVSEQDPQFNYRTDKDKWGWSVSFVKKISPTLPPKKRGIIYALDCKVYY